MIELKSVTADWGEGMFGLRDINLAVRQGELVAVVGQVGCGKTSLLITLLQVNLIRSCVCNQSWIQPVSHNCLKNTQSSSHQLLIFPRS